MPEVPKVERGQWGWPQWGRYRDILMISMNTMPKNRKAVSLEGAHGDNPLTGISSCRTVGGPILGTPPAPRP